MLRQIGLYIVAHPHHSCVCWGCFGIEGRVVTIELCVCVGMFSLLCDFVMAIGAIAWLIC